LGLGLGLDGPWVAQAWPKGHPSIAQGRPKGRFWETSLFATQTRKWGVGVGFSRVMAQAGAAKGSPRSRVIAEIAVIGNRSTTKNRRKTKTEKEVVASDGPALHKT